MRTATLRAIVLGLVAVFATPAAAMGDPPARPKTTGRIEFDGVACFVDGTPVRDGRVFDESTHDTAQKKTILGSQARLVLDFDQARITGRIYLKFKHFSQFKDGPPYGYTHSQTYDIEYEASGLAEMGMPPAADRPWLEMRPEVTGSSEHDGKKSTPEKTRLQMVWFRDPNLVVPGHKELRGDFVLVYKDWNEYRLDTRRLIEQVRTGKLGPAVAVLWKTGGSLRTATPPSGEGGDGGEGTPSTTVRPGGDGGDDGASETGTGGTVGEASTKVWTVTHAGGTVQCRVGDGPWRNLTSGMKIGSNVTVRTGGDGVLEIQVLGRTTEGGTYPQATSRLGHNTEMRVGPPEEKNPASVFINAGWILFWDAAGPDPKVAPTIITPTARVTPVGTKFSVEHDAAGQRTTVSVEQGKVEVAPAHPDLPRQLLDAGGQAVVGLRDMTVSGPEGTQEYRAESDPPPSTQREIDERASHAQDGPADRSEAEQTHGLAAWVWVLVVVGVVLCLALVAWVTVLAIRRRSP